MRKLSNLAIYERAMDPMRSARNKSEAWINDNLHFCAFPPLQLYACDGNTRWWVSNDPLLGLRFTDWDYRFAELDRIPQDGSRLGTAAELSARSVAILHDHMMEHWNSPESKRLRATATSIASLMENPANAGDHPTVKAIESLF